MRDSRRIPLVLGTIAQYWAENPDMRFFQMVESLKSMLPQEQVSMKEQVAETIGGKVHSTVSVRDAYEVEDEVLLETLMLAMMDAPDA